MRLVQVVAVGLAFGCTRVPPAAATGARQAAGEAVATTEVGLALLTADQWVYWMEPHAVRRVAKAGGKRSRLDAPRLAHWVFLEHSGTIYFVDASDYVLSWPAALANSRFTSVGISARGAAVWENQFFWTTELGDVKHADMSSWTTETIARGQSEPLAIVVDGAYVYWTNQGEDTSSPLDTHAPRRGAGLMCVPRAGGAVVALASCTGFCWDLVATSGGILFSDFVTGDILRVDKKSRRRTVVAWGQRDVRALEVDGTTVYWAVQGGRILRVPETGGRPEVVATGVEVRDLAVDDSYVYWLDADRPKGTGTLRRIRK